jgi:hypothetical protein
MMRMGKFIRLSTLLSSALFITATYALVSQAQTQPTEQSAQSASPGSAARSVGTVKAVAGNSITLTTDAGSDVNILLQPPAVMVRTAPGHKDLQGATPLQLQDIKAGDRMLVRGKLSDDGKSIVAASAIVMKREDIVQKQEQQQEDWRKRGINGVVKSVDPATGIIAVTTGSAAAKTISVHVSKDTILRRYAPDSVRFDDAKLGTIGQIKPGDQLRARGDRSADGTEFTAEEIVSGSFRNVAGTVVSTDASNNTVTVTDLLSKKPLTVKVGPDSQLRKLPAMIAQGIALRLKGGAPSGSTGGSPGTAGPGGGSSPASPVGPPSNAAGPGAGMPGGEGRTRAGGQADFQEMLSRMPAVELSDLKKGDAVMIVTTEGSATSDPTAITLLTGVEPILSASPSDNRAAMTLSPWSLEAPGGEAGP